MNIWRESESVMQPNLEIMTGIRAGTGATHACSIRGRSRIAEAEVHFLFILRN